MKYYIYIILVWAIPFLVHAQKPAVDSTVFGKWNKPSLVCISNDGKYVIVVDGQQFILQNTSLTKPILLGKNVQRPCFSTNSKKLFFQAEQSLLSVNLKNNTVDTLSNISSFELLTYNGNDWIIYQTNNNSKSAFIKNINSGITVEIKDVKQYYSEKESSFVIFWIENGQQTKISQLNCYDLHTGETREFYTGEITTEPIVKIDSKHQQIAFLLSYNYGKKLWHYRAGDLKSTRITSPFIDDQEFSRIGRFIAFSSDGKRIVAQFKKNSENKVGKYDANVDVWSYNDPILQSRQLLTSNLPSNCVYVYSLLKGHWSQISLPGEAVYGLPDINSHQNSDVRDDYCLVFSKSQGDIQTEWFWNKTSRYNVYLVNSNDGSRTLIKNDLVSEKQQNHYKLSPNGKYLLYYDADRMNFFSYEITTGITRNITNGICTKWTGTDPDVYRSILFDLYGIGYFIDYRHVLLYDRRDIWQIDMSGTEKPRNLTRLPQDNHRTIFRIVQIRSSSVNKKACELILSAFDIDSKMDGYYSLILNGRSLIKKLSQQPALFSGTSESKDAGTFPVFKAKSAEKYVVYIQTESEAPNLYLTADFISFKKLTNYAPQKDYNWVTSELIRWPKPNGSIGQGILYKPENFDPSKKYPLIFSYYEKHSADLHQFRYPDYSHTGEIDIPYYVSNGFLIFCPDIDFTIGKPGESVYNTVVSAAEYLSTLPFINRQKLGINGHSRGGWETNYLITHTTLFAAALVGAGPANYISLYAGIRSNGTSRQDGPEVISQRIGATLWQKPERYIENSPIFFADKVTTPLLMVHNKGDDDIPFTEGVEFFTSLRRLGKKVWMLQYDNESHHTLHPIARRDLTIRAKQFFDFYLIDKPAPKWMLDGVPAKLKNIESGLELDTTGRKPGPGLLIDQKQ